MERAVQHEDRAFVVRLPVELRAAIERAAGQNFETSASFVRRTLADRLRQDGVLSTEGRDRAA
jgi:hypothetical protein